MSWPLAHKLGGTLLFYGPETWTLYIKGLEAARAWLDLPAGSPWTPLLVLWSAHLLGGFAAALVGLAAGRGAAPGFAAMPAGHAVELPKRKDAPAGDPSLPALFLHLFCVAAAMSLGSRMPLWLFAAAAAVYVGLCVRFWPRAARLMGKAGLWTGLLLAAVLAGLLLGRWQAGAAMGLRALVLTLGFSCIGSELSNPVLRSWLERRGGRLFFAALEQAFDSLPAVFAGLPPAKALLRHPVASLRSAVARAPGLLEALSPARVFIVTGAQGEGKSSLIAALAEALRGAGLIPVGFHAPGFWAEGRRSGFDLIDLGGGERLPLCRTDGPQEWPSQGPFRFSPEGLAFGRRALSEALRRGPDLVIVDEVGPLELRGEGWSEGLDALVRGRRAPMVWVVREGLIDEVRLRWGLADDRVWDAGAGAPGALAAEILRELPARSRT